jgi:hypothetical protein
MLAFAHTESPPAAVRATQRSVGDRVTFTCITLRDFNSQKRLRLNDKERLFPGPNHSSEKDQEHSICFPAHWSFDLSSQDDQLVSQQCVFRQQFDFASGQIYNRAGHKGGRGWFDPTPHTFLERMQAKTDALLDRGK